MLDLLAYAEEYIVDVRFACDRIGTVLFDHRLGARKDGRRYLKSEGQTMLLIGS
ncbi:MAG TPA: hypothetical protein VKB89_29580 [Xanthobacteraceae bacterium]|nr:hypothetical protein [Xanthobacteraceae bacterium]